jgi:hypothetical protein
VECILGDNLRCSNIMVYVQEGVRCFFVTSAKLIGGVFPCLCVYSSSDSILRYSLSYAVPIVFKVSISWP